MNNIYYTYVHRKINGEVFYVGKGKSNRAWVKAKRSKYWKAVVAKYGCVVQIIDKNLPESVAFELEEFLISYYKIKNDGGCLVNLTRGGEGSSGHSPSPKTKLKMSESGKIAANLRPHDTSTYTFVNCKTLEEFIGTRRQFKDEKGVNTASLFTVRTDHTVHNWCLKENLAKAMKAHTDFNVYTFVHANGEQITSTREEFREKTGVCTNDMFRTRDNKCGSVSGWFIPAHRLNKSPQIKLDPKQPICPSTIYTFIHVDGKIISATRRDFKQQTGIDPKQLFKSEKWRYKSVAGWSLSPTL